MSCNFNSILSEQERDGGQGDSCDHKCRRPPRNVYHDLCRKFKNLYTKWNYNQPRRRIQELSMPKYRRAKFRPCGHCHTSRGRQVQIIRDRASLSTRAEQLAYSPVRKLIATRNDARSIVSPVLYERFNKYIHRGMYSMYARLSNALPPVIINPIKPWSKQDWENYTENLKKLSIPKKIHEPPIIIRVSRSLAKLEKRMTVLATPKFKPRKVKSRPVVSPAALKCVATERVNELSRPKLSREPPPRKQRTFRGKKYDASDRTKELAKHREKKTAISETKENPFQVPPNALKARITARVKNLAKHKVFNLAEAKDPLKISPAALKAEASKRILELAQPKKAAAKG